jgi:hypothetical protein
MSTPTLRACAHCGGPARQYIQLQAASWDGTALEIIECTWCGVALHSGEKRPQGTLADLLARIEAHLSLEEAP